MYLTKRWIGRWWWYTHTRRKYKLRVIKVGKIHVGQVSYKIGKELN